MARRVYRVHTRQVYAFIDTMEVEAEDEESARKLALETAECEWSDSFLLSSDAEILEECHGSEQE